MHFITRFFIFAVLISVTQPLAADGKNPTHMHVTVGKLEIHHIWSRATPPNAKSGVAYLMINNTGSTDDVLKSVSSPHATNTMIHETVMKDGVMTMSHVMSLTIPAGGSVALEPGGLHIMLMGLQSPLKADASYPLTLTFEKSGTATIDVPVLKVGKTLEHTH